jgi:hypothetical protein
MLTCWQNIPMFLVESRQQTSKVDYDCMHGSKEA